MLFHLFQVLSTWPPHQHHWACLRYRARRGQWLLKPSCEEKRLPRQSPLFLSNLGQWWVAVLLPSLGLAGVWFWSKGPNLGSSVHRHTQSLGPTSISSPNWVFDSLPWPYDRIALNQDRPHDANMAFTSAVCLDTLRGVRTQQSLPPSTETERPGRRPLRSTLLTCHEAVCRLSLPEAHCKWMETSSILLLLAPSSMVGS